jgi:peptide/nickel transport system substrate-binding protein
MDNNSFDPAQLNIGNQSQFWGPLFDTLLVKDKDNKLMANVATSWEYDSSLTQMTMKLRDGVTFSDGAPLDAEAVKANFANLAAGTGQNAYMAKSVQEVTIVGPTELVIHLAQPDPGFVEYLASVGGAMASPKSLKAPDVASNPVGSGPYVLDKANTVPGSTYTYVRRDGYWNAKAWPYDKMILKPMTDLTARLNALKAGQVNGAIAEIPSVKEAEASGLTVNASQVNWVGLLLMDRDGRMVPELRDVRVRQAINFAFDWQSILDNLAEGRGRHTTQIFSPKSTAFSSTADSVYTYDLGKAKALMAAAGVSGFTFQMARPPAYDAFCAVTEESLKQIGITINWVPVSPNAAITEALSGRYPVVFFTLGSQSAWQDIQKAVIPTAPWNPFKCQDPQLAALLADAQHSPEADQPRTMSAVSEWLVDHAWFAPWFRVDNIYLTDAKTTVQMDPYVVAPPVGNFAPKG